MSPPVRKKVMISYAHDDKDFVWPLADELGKHHDVWIDRDQMTVGDSVFAQVSKGLREADFAVVVFSPSYVRKAWTQRELAGLTTLEDEERKIILPVWKDIDKPGVRAFSSFMADRIAASAARGFAAVADDLCFAIAAASKTAAVVPKPAGAQKMAAFGQDLKAREAALTMLRTVEGAGLVTAAYEEICKLIELQLKSIETDSLRFNCKRGAQGMLLVHTRFMLTLRLFLENMDMNSATEAKLKVHVFRRAPAPELGGASGDPTELDGQDYAPWFSDGVVVWRLTEKKTFDGQGVVDVAIDLLRQQLQSESS